MVLQKDLSYQAELLPLINSDDKPITLQAVTHNFLLPRFKTVDRTSWDSIIKNKLPEADDVLVINAQGNVAETSIYSVFYKIGDEFFTPPLSDGCLHGVFRTHHIKKGFITLDDKSFKLSEKSLPLTEIRSVELYVANSVRGLKKATLLF